MRNFAKGTLTRPHLQKLKTSLLLLTVCIFGISISCRSMVFSGFRQMQTDPGDTRFNNYVLEHEYQWVTGNPLHSSFWDSPDFYPAKNVMAYSDILLGVAPLYSLIRALGFLPDTAYQLWMLALLGLNFYVTYWVFRRLRFSLFPSLVVGYLFAFANMRISQIGHQQLLPHFFTPVMVLAVSEIFQNFCNQTFGNQTFGKRKRARPRIWAGILATMLVLQLYSGFYLGWFAVFGLSLTALVALCKTRLRAILLTYLKTEAFFLIAVGALTLLALMPMGYHYWLASQKVGLRPFSSVSPMLIRIPSWFNLGEESFAYGFLYHFAAFRRIPMQGEQRVGLGLVTLGLAVLGLVRAKKQSSAQLSSWVWAGVVLLTLYTGRRFWGVEPWELVYSFFPGAKAIRAVSRICLMILIPASFGLAYFFEGISKDASPKGASKDAKKPGIRKLLPFALFAVIILEQLNTTPSYDKMAIRDDVHWIASKIPSSCKSFLYTSSQSDAPSYKLHIDAIWAGLTRNLPTLNGYSGNAPQGWLLGEINQEMPHSQIQNAISSWTQKYEPSFDFQCWIDEKLPLARSIE